MRVEVRVLGLLRCPLPAASASASASGKGDRLRFFGAVTFLGSGAALTVHAYVCGHVA